MAKPLHITLPDGSVREHPPGTTGLQLAESIGRRLARDALAIEVNGEVESLQLPLPDGARVAILTRSDKAGMEVLRHSAAHVMAEAIKKMRPQAKLWKGPPVDDPRYGYYYDVDLGEQPIVA